MLLCYLKRLTKKRKKNHTNVTTPCLSLPPCGLRWCGMFPAIQVGMPYYRLAHKTWDNILKLRVKQKHIKLSSGSPILSWKALQEGVIGSRAVPYMCPRCKDNGGATAAFCAFLLPLLSPPLPSMPFSPSLLPPLALSALFFISSLQLVSHLYKETRHGSQREIWKMGRRRKLTERGRRRGRGRKAWWVTAVVSSFFPCSRHQWLCLLAYIQTPWKVGEQCYPHKVDEGLRLS